MDSELDDFRLRAAVVASALPTKTVRPYRHDDSRIAGENGELWPSAQYARAFLYTETDDNDATYFILYQLSVLTRAIRDLHTYLDRKAAEIRDVEDLVRRSATLRAELNSRQLDLLTHALKHPQMEYTVESHRRAHGIAYGTARTDLLMLAKRDLLEQRKRGRAFVFVAPIDLRARMGRRRR